MKRVIRDRIFFVLTVIIAALFLLLTLCALILNPTSTIFTTAIQSAPEQYVYGIPPTLDATHQILDYLWFGRTYNLDFSDQARMHMADVRSLFVAGQIAIVVSGILLLILLQRFSVKEKAKIFSRAAAINIVLTIFCGLFGAVWFEKLFYIFHELLFRNSLWLFPPQDSLVLFFPSYFFESVAVQMSIWFLICCVLLIGASRALRNSA